MCPPLFSTILSNTNRWYQGYVVATSGVCAVLVGNFGLMFMQDADGGSDYKPPAATNVPPPS